MLLKRIAAFLLALLLIFSPMCMRPAYAADSPATPTDLAPYEDLMVFEDDEWGYIDPEIFERKVYIDFLHEPQHYGDECILIAILVDFQPYDNPTFEWQYSTNCEEWIKLEGQTEKTYSFIIDKENIGYYYRVVVTI